MQPLVFNAVGSRKTSTADELPIGCGNARWAGIKVNRIGTDLKNLPQFIIWRKSKQLHPVIR